MGAENPPSQTGRHACRKFRSSRENGRLGKVESFVPLSETPASGGKGHFPAGILPTEQSGLKRLPAGERIATENSCHARKRDERGIRPGFLSVAMRPFSRMARQYRCFLRQGGGVPV